VSCTRALKLIHLFVTPMIFVTVMLVMTMMTVMTVMSPVIFVMMIVVSPMLMSVWVVNVHMIFGLHMPSVAMFFAITMRACVCVLNAKGDPRGSNKRSANGLGTVFSKYERREGNKGKQLTPWVVNVVSKGVMSGVILLAIGSTVTASVSVHNQDGAGQQQNRCQHRLG
jgi:hypothetical protein